MMIDDDTLKKLLRINDELMQLCKWLNEKRDMETSSRLIPLVDDLTHILIEAGKNKMFRREAVYATLFGSDDRGLSRGSTRCAPMGATTGKEHFKNISGILDGCRSSGWR